MALLRYMKPVSGVSDPRGLLSCTISIAETDKEVQKAKSSCKHCPYTKYSATLRAQIEKYAYTSTVQLQQRDTTAFPHTCVRHICSVYETAFILNVCINFSCV